MVGRGDSRYEVAGHIEAVGRKQMGMGAIAQLEFSLFGLGHSPQMAALTFRVGLSSPCHLSGSVTLTDMSRDVSPK